MNTRGENGVIFDVPKKRLCTRIVKIVRIGLR